MTNRMGQPLRGRAHLVVSFAVFALLSLCLPGAASAQWVTNGNTTSTTNNVGIGTGPSQMFQVHSPGTWAGMRVTTAGTGSTVNDGVNFGYDEAYGAFVWNREASPIVFSTGNLERMRLDASGNVGIGTVTPGTRLDVGAGAPPRGNESDVLIGAGGINPQLEFYGSSKSSAITHSDADGGLIFYTNGPTWTPAFFLSNGGNVGVGTLTPGAKLDVAGDIRVSGNINAKYQDVAEWVPTTQNLAAGTVVVLDTRHDNHVAASTVAYDTAVAGVVSAQPGLTLGEAGEGKALVATTGRVKVKVDATRSPIKVGDLLVTSDVEGVAMRSEPVSLGGVLIHRPGTIIGKALEPLAKGTGEILVLLSLQ
jgi:hypothetical protein